MNLDRSAIAQAIDAAIASAGTDHVDLAPLLGLSTPLRVGLDDLGAVIAGGEPTLRVEWDAATVTVSRQDGGVMGTVAIRF